MVPSRGIPGLADLPPGGREASQMNRRRLLAVLVASGALFAGCSTAPEVQSPRPARLDLPSQAVDAIRLVIYRPQTLVGMWGKPIVLVNDRPMGVQGSPVNENFLQPGSVFVVDAPASLTRVRWLQSRQAQPGDDVITFQGLPGATRYLRWTLKPTSGFLHQVDERTAVEEIVALRYTGYVSLIAR